MQAEMHWDTNLLEKMMTMVLTQELQTTKTMTMTEKMQNLTLKMNY